MEVPLVAGADAAAAGCELELDRPEFAPDLRFLLLDVADEAVG